MQKQEKKYYRFSEYLNRRFGCRVYRVSVDAGFSCPNRDGSKSSAGCIFCDNRGFSFNSRIAPVPLEEQIRSGMEAGKRRFQAEKFILYFQAYTNTYAPPDELKARYDIIKKFDDIVALSIGTRPDCVDDAILDLIAGYAGDYEVWLEYGLQSIHERTLKLINRGHVYRDFLAAVERTRKKKQIKICAHVIIGLPGETREDILATAGEIGRLKLEGVKIHPLHVIRGTRLEQAFNNKEYRPLELAEYADLTAEFLERLWPQTVIQRISADCPAELLAAPLWISEKAKVLTEIDLALSRRNSFQGRLYKS